mmetsp:Transcript_13202/g.52913  ORF Transcript_13202/g.52913 Transcript_13202/m.52913 type:complete len:135 (-) Transcript_13202:2075-2479(-)
MWNREALAKLRERTTTLLHLAWRRGGRVAWIVAATSIVMVLPLLMEIEREGSVIELEKLQIKDLKAQGFTVRPNPVRRPCHRMCARRRTRKSSRWASCRTSSRRSDSTRRRRRSHYPSETARSPRDEAQHRRLR